MKSKEYSVVNQSIRYQSKRSVLRWRHHFRHAKSGCGTNKLYAHIDKNDDVQDLRRIPLLNRKNDPHQKASAILSPVWVLDKRDGDKEAWENKGRQGPECPDQYPEADPVTLQIGQG